MTLEDITSGSDLDSLKEVYVFANTPSYIYKNFRKHRAVYELSRSYDAATLMDYFEQNVSAKEKSLEHTVLAYVFLIALTFKKYHEIKQYIDELDKFQLDWLNELRFIIKDNARIDDNFEMDLSYIDGPNFKSGSATNTDISKDPKININIKTDSL